MPLVGFILNQFKKGFFADNNRIFFSLLFSVSLSQQLIPLGLAKIVQPDSQPHLHNLYLTSEITITAYFAI